LRILCPNVTLRNYYHNNKTEMGGAFSKCQLHKESGGGWRAACGGLAGGSGGEVSPRRTASGAATLGTRGLSDFFSRGVPKTFSAPRWAAGQLLGTPGAGRLPERCARPRAAASRWEVAARRGGGQRGTRCRWGLEAQQAAVARTSCRRAVALVG
jgi:hypothetical protein